MSHRGGQGEEGPGTASWGLVIVCPVSFLILERWLAGALPPILSQAVGSQPRVSMYRNLFLFWWAARTLSHPKSIDAHQLTSRWPVGDSSNR